MDSDANRHTLTITDNDDTTPPPPEPVVAFASAAQSAGEAAGTRNVTVNLNPAPTSAITLAYAAGGTATASSDYRISGSGSVSVSSGATTATIAVAITDDNAQESDETVILTLTGGTGYAVDSNANRHTLTITDNDDTPSPPPSSDGEGGSRAEEGGQQTPSAPPPSDGSTNNGEGSSTNNGGGNSGAEEGGQQTPSAPPPLPFVSGVSMADLAVAEGGIARFIVRLETVAAEEVRIEWVTVSGTARAGQDYDAGRGTLHIPAGETTATLAVRTLQDRLAEDDEMFTVRLLNTRQSGSESDEPVEAVGTIRDDERAFAFAEEVGDQAYTAGTTITALVLPEATGGQGEVTYRVSGLPAGLSFDAATRTISGTPEAATDGAIEVAYLAEDSPGAAIVLTFSITVNPPLNFGDFFDLLGGG